MVRSTSTMNESVADRLSPLDVTSFCSQHGQSMRRSGACKRFGRLGGLNRLSNRSVWSAPSVPSVFCIVKPGGDGEEGFFVPRSARGCTHARTYVVLSEFVQAFQLHFFCVVVCVSHLFSIPKIEGLLKKFWRLCVNTSSIGKDIFRRTAQRVLAKVEGFRKSIRFQENRFQLMIFRFSGSECLRMVLRIDFDAVVPAPAVSHGRAVVENIASAAVCTTVRSWSTLPPRHP